MKEDTQRALLFYAKAVGLIVVIPALSSALGNILTEPLKEVFTKLPGWLSSLLTHQTPLWAYLVVATTLAPAPWLLRRLVSGPGRVASGGGPAAYTSEPLPPAAPPTIPSAPASSPRPGYKEDVIEGIRWRWGWYFSEPGKWFPDELVPYCPDPGCDMRMEIKLAPTPYAHAHESTLFRCLSGRCPTVTVQGMPHEVRDRVKARIESNWRNGRRGG